MTTTTTTKPGALALSRLEHEAGEKFIGSKPQPKTALADLRALIARCEQAEADKMTLSRKLMEARDDWQTSKAHADRLAGVLIEGRDGEIYRDNPDWWGRVDAALAAWRERGSK